MEVLLVAITIVLILVVRYLDRINRNLVALRLQNAAWDGKEDEVPFHVVKSGMVECITREGYKVFRSEKAFRRFLVKRPDIR
jgi:hypothetical protein